MMRSPIDTLINLNQSDERSLLPNSAEYQMIWETTIGWHPDADQLQLFQQMYRAVLQGNQVFNLTRITEPEEFWEKHLWDSMSGIRAFLNEDTPSDESSELIPFDISTTDTSIAATSAAGDSEKRDGGTLVTQPLNVIDIGTGAGFPGLPVAIACPAWQVTLLDSTRKKTRFLDAVITALHIQNAATVTERVEAVGRAPRSREHYDLALLRAVAPVSVCAEYALPLLKLGGWAVLYRGHWTDEDAETLLPALDVLGGEVELIDQLHTPLSKGDRHCIILRKVAPTPDDFPRSVGVPAKDPL